MSLIPRFDCIWIISINGEPLTVRHCKLVIMNNRTELKQLIFGSSLAVRGRAVYRDSCAVPFGLQDQVMAFSTSHNRTTGVSR